MKLFFTFLFLIVGHFSINAQLSLSGTSTPSNCANDGSITLTATGGDDTGLGYQYSIDTPDGATIGPQSNPIFESLPSGNYIGSVTDNSGTTVTTNVVVDGNYTPPALSRTITEVNDCTPYYNVDVNIDSGGLAPYVYDLLDNGTAIQTSGTITTTTHTFTNINSGSYLVRVTDACGTQRTIGVELDELINSPLNAGADRLKDCNTTNLDLKFFGTATYPINAVVTYANFPTETYTFNSIDDANIDVMNDTNVTVSFTDACNETDQLIYNFNVEDNGEVSSNTRVENCAYTLLLNPNLTNVSIPLACTNVQYCLIDENNVETCQSTNEFNGIAPGTYTMEVRDLCCNDVYSSPITLAPLPTPSIAKTISTRQCNSGTATINLGLTNFSNAELTFISSSASSYTIMDVNGGGEATLNYQIGDVIPPSIADQRYTFSNLPIGTYEFQITDDCAGTIDYTLEVTEQDIVVYDVFAEYTLGCTGQNQITYGVNQISGPTVWRSSPGRIDLYDAGNNQVDTSNGFGEKTRTVTNLNDGLYTAEFLITGEGGATSLFGNCLFTNTIEIDIPPYQLPDLSSSTRYECSASTESTIIANAIGVEPLMYSISELGANSYSTPQSSPVFTGLDPNKQYNIRVSDGCSNSNNYDVTTVSSLNEPMIEAEFNCLDGQVNSVKAELSGNEVFGAEYEWMNSSGMIVGNERILTFDPFTDNDIDTYTLTVSIPGTLNTECNTVSSDYVISSRDCELLLPIKLLYFNSEVIEDYVQLIWETSSEIDFSHFEIEHSLNGIDFETIGFEYSISSNGDGKLYDFNHYTPVNGNNYYRLKSVDLDGTFEYSDITVATLTGNESLNRIKIWPNPISQAILNIQSLDEVINDIKVVSIDGSVQLHFSEVNTHNFTIDVNGLSNGFYIVIINDKQNEKLIVY